MTRLILGNLASWTHASAILYASETYNPLAILDALEIERCTGVHGVPTHFLGLLNAIETGKQSGKAWNLSTLRYVWQVICSDHVSHSDNCLVLKYTEPE
jgi:hypothetical protein